MAGRARRTNDERTHAIAPGWTVEVFPDPEKRSRSIVRILGPGDLLLEVLDAGDGAVRSRETRAIELARILAQVTRPA